MDLLKIPIKFEIDDDKAVSIAEILLGLIEQASAYFYARIPVAEKSSGWKP